MTRPEITGYLLAGGRSSRMGENKALCRLGGVTLLERALACLHAVTADVAIVGSPVVPGVASIPDTVPGHGPLGGIEAALNDLRHEWAVFLPVDIPLLPHRLFAALVEDWLRQSESGCRIGFVVVEGVSQPLVSLMHKDVLPYVRRALQEGSNKVVPVLEEAALQLAGNAGRSVDTVLRRTEFEAGEATRSLLSWSPTLAENAIRQLWFANLNTPAELREAEAMLDHQGSATSAFSCERS